MALEVETLDPSELDHPGILKEVIDRDGKVMDGVTITVYSIDSSIHRKALNQIQQRRLNSTSRTGRLNLVAEVLDSERVELVARCTKEWTGLVDNGQSWPCNYANALKLYTARPDIFDQVNAFMADRAGFLSISKNGSAPQ